MGRARGIRQLRAAFATKGQVTPHVSNDVYKRLIAPCGMDCGICMAYLRKKNQCPGCRSSDIGKAISVTKCRIKTCEVLKKKRARFCFQCEHLPCDRLKHLDRRYRTK